MFIAVILTEVTGCKNRTEQYPTTIQDAREESQIKASNLDFGEQWENPGFKWTVTFHNSSGNPVTIENIKPNCKCTAVEPQELHLEAQESGSVIVTIDTTKNNSRANDGAPADFSTSLSATIIGMKRGIEYKIHGKVKAMFDVRPGRQISSPDGAIIYEYLIKYIADVVKFTVEADPSEITTLTIPQSSKEILLTVYPNPKTQSTMLDLIVSGYDAHGNSSSHKLSVGSSAVREARVIPSDLNWGVVQLGKVERNTIHVPGVTSQNAIIDAVASDASLSVEIGAYSDGHVGAKFDITHRIDKLGEQKSYIDIRLKSDKGVNPIRIPVYYWGVEKL